MNNACQCSNFYGNEAEQYDFLYIPKFLFQDPECKKLSVEAKLLYSLFLERLPEARQKGWFDEQRRVFIYFPIDEMCQTLKCSNKTCIKAVKELDSKTGVGLIEKERRGLGEPDRIFLKKPKFHIGV